MWGHINGEDAEATACPWFQGSCKFNLSEMQRIVGRE